MSREIYRYVEKYIELCSLLCKHEADYTKENIKIHNKAMKELNKLIAEISNDIEKAKCMYEVLLSQEDVHIKQLAATDCLNFNIYVKEAVKILKKISTSGNRMASMGAKRTLRIWKGELDPSDPF